MSIEKPAQVLILRTSVVGGRYPLEWRIARYGDPTLPRGEIRSELTPEQAGRLHRAFADSAQYLTYLAAVEAAQANDLGEQGKEIVVGATFNWIATLAGAEER